MNTNISPIKVYRQMGGMVANSEVHTCLKIWAGCQTQAGKYAKLKPLIIFSLAMNTYIFTVQNCQMGGGQHPPIPDWRIYKVENVPQLVELQRKLAAQGLKDPWIRNEVWRYGMNEYIGTSHAVRFLKCFGRGFKYGLILAVTHAAIKSIFFPDKSHEDHH